MTDHRLGEHFGKLTVISDEPKRLHEYHNNLWWLCRCECGIERYFLGTRLRKGKAKSCGCVSYKNTTKNRVSKYSCDFNIPSIKRAYKSWQAMKYRCSGKTDKNIKNYQNRNITICNSWINDFEAFLKDMGPRPINTTLGRENNDEIYEKDNCRWERSAQQQSNKRSTIYVDFQGNKIALVILCKRLKVDYRVIRGRIRNGWSLDTALKTPIRRYRKHPHPDS